MRNFLLLTLFTSGYCYFVDEHYNCSTVAPLNNKTIGLTYLGQFNSTGECIKECISKQCDSYTYYFSNSNNSNLSFQCVGYINNTMYIPYITPESNCGRIIYPCTSDYDCSLNGKCDIKTGNCTCRPGWNGYKCHFLSLLPANKSAGYLSPFNKYTSTSWGGGVVFDKIRNNYVMLVSEMQNNCGINAWRRNCEIVYADTQNGNWNSEYVKKSTLIIPFSCTPDLIYAHDTDEFVLFYVVNTSWPEIPPCICLSGSTPPTCNDYQNVTETTQFITIKTEDLSNGYNLDSWSLPININDIGIGDSNFAAVINNDSSLIGMIRAHLITATNWKDNTTYIRHENLLFPGVGTEDYFLYKDCDEYYHVLVHNQVPDTHLAQYCGGHAFSMDGIVWQYGGLSYSNNVQFTDGSQFTFTRRERPHLIFDKSDGCTPIALTNSAEYGGIYGDKAYTLLQPINH